VEAVDNARSYLPMDGTNRLKSEILSYQVVADSVLEVIYESRFSAKSVIITKNKEYEQL
tara:strand:+ start:560 stop:736 length:177 start_codon:yes stop_codon:yes gene_type:complete